MDTAEAVHTAKPDPYEGGFQRVERLAQLLDEGVPLPVVRLKMPLDPIIGLVPVLGDVTMLLISGSTIVRAKQLGASNGLLARMIANILADCVFGAVPLLGDVFDFFFRANKRNMQLLHKHLVDNDPTS